MDKNLDNNRIDYVTMLAKAGAGAVPVVGSLLTELAGTLIPNQRMDRLVKFARELEGRLSTIEQGTLAQNLHDPQCADLLEEGMRQAASSLSDERRAYIAALVENSLTVEEISHQESKHLLKILGDISDVEIIVLRSYLVETIGGDEEFRKRHADVLDYPVAYLNSPQSDLDKSAIYDSYKNHLVRLGLLEERFRLDPKTKQIKVDSFGRMEKQGVKITPVGRLLLRTIGFSEVG